MLLETPTTLARDGGFKLLTPTLGLNSNFLPPTHRNFAIEDNTSLPFVFPFATDGQFRPILPLGHTIWIHNISPVLPISVWDGASLTVTLAAGRSACLVLKGYAGGGSRHGLWERIAWNHTNGSGPAMPDGFRMDMTVYAPRNNLNLLEEAVARGYTGSVAALVTLLIPSNSLVGSSTPLAAALDTGGDAAVAGINWFAGSLVVLRQEGRVQGCGGRGGAGQVGGTASGTFGEDGGLAIRARISMVITNLGKILGGCGGGGGGGGLLTTPGVSGGGGGGGGGARVDASGLIVGGDGNNGGGTGTQRGQDGSPEQGGAGGQGSILLPNFAGAGGAGGNYTATTYAPQAGSAGQLANGGGTGLAGGAAGPAISRHASATVTFTPGGTGIVGGSTIVA